MTLRQLLFRRSVPAITGATTFIRRLHADCRGNIAILFLLIVFCLMSLIGLVWNTSEMATRHQALQTAADTSAHAAATWISRCTNLVAAQNMVICQNSSAEVMWRSIPPADAAVRTRLEREEADVTAMLSGGDPQYESLRSRMLDALRQVDNEYAIANSALQSARTLSSQVFADPQQGDALRDSIRQAGEVLEWVSDTYVSGNPAAGQPGPPGPAGEGLRDLAALWNSPPDLTIFLSAIVASLEQQLVALGDFELRTAPAVAQDVPGQVAAHNAQVFATQQQMVAQITPTISDQLAEQGDFYGVRLTIADTGRGAQPDGPAQLPPPVVRADDPSIAPEPHFDSLRGEMIDIDAINVHTDAATITWPNTESQSVIIASRTINFAVNCNLPGGWGHMYGAPLKRYFQQRVWNDQQELATHMQRIDDLRRHLAEELRRLRALPTNDNIAPLPATHRDSISNSSVPVLPRLVAPADATDELRAQVTLYNEHAAAYTGAVRNLAGLLRSWAQYYDRFTIPFAVEVWHGRVSQFRDVVLRQMGMRKEFMVLATYRLRTIPDWARPGMFTSAELSIRDRIISQNIGPVGVSILNALVAAHPSGLGGGFLDPAGRDAVLSARYSAQASQAALDAIGVVAARVAPIIAAEWVSRPWPYEITPPDDPVPPSSGIGRNDRQTYFTLLTAARPSTDTAPRLVFPRLTQTQTPELLTHAQAETFNWMEFNPAYGGGELFDQVSADPNVHFVGCPLPWRVSTVGGWNWHSRLAVADALSPSIAANPELKTYFTEGGVTQNDPEAIKTLTLH